MTRLIAQILVTLALAGPALADSHDATHAHVELLPGWRTDDGTHMAALRITLDDGWKTYWRAPGEAGLPPNFDWSGSQNLEQVIAHWPVPDVFDSGGTSTLGYYDELVLPLEIVPSDPSVDVALSGNLAMGICEHICLPMQAEVSAVLSDGQHTVDPRIEAALVDRPETAEVAGLVSARCDVTPIADGVRVVAQLEFPAVGANEFAVIEAADPGIWVSSAMTARVGDTLTTEADLVPPTAQPFDLDPATLRFTVIADGKAVDIQGCDR